MRNHSMKQLWILLKSAWLWIILSFICAATQVILSLMIPIYTGRAIDAMMGIGQVNFDTITRILLMILIYSVIVVLGQWGLIRCLNHISYQYNHKSLYYYH